MRTIILVTVVFPVLLFGQTQRREQNPASDIAPGSVLSRARLAAIRIVGSTRYSETEVIRASGLKLNEPVDTDALQAASERLGLSGAFASVQYQFSAGSKGIEAVFRVADNQQLVPVRFENLVWFTDDELQSGIQSRVALFHDRLPPAGTMQDEVKSAVEAMLAERGLGGTVNIEAQSTFGSPVQAFLVHVDGVRIRVSKVRFSGIKGMDAALLSKAAQPLFRSAYERSFVSSLCQGAIQDLYLERGFLKMACGSPTPEVLGSPGGETEVAVTIPVEEGTRYRFAGLNWSGNNAFGADKLSPLIKLVPGQVANSLKLQEDLREVRKLYGTKGYLDEKVEATPVFKGPDEVIFELQLHEGEGYRMGRLEMAGLPPENLAKMRSSWQLGEGAVYDESYSRTFFKETAGNIPRGTMWEWRLVEKINDKQKTVDVQVTWQPKR